MTSCSQLSLLELPPSPEPISGNYRRTDPISSVVAGRECNATAQRARILAVMRRAGRPMYVHEIHKATGIPAGEVGSRLPVMARIGSVRLLPEMGLNHRGKPVQMWEPVL